MTLTFLPVAEIEEEKKKEEDDDDDEVKSDIAYGTVCMEPTRAM